MVEALQDSWIALIAFGLFTGVFAGVFGLGGGAVLVPLLVLVFAKEQATAQGMSMAMILSPTAAPAILRYHQGGHIDWRLVLWIAPFMLLGSYFGAKLAVYLPGDVLRVSFAVVLTYTAGYMIFSKLGDVRTALIYSAIPVAVMLVLIAWSGVGAMVVSSLRTWLAASGGEPDAIPADLD